MATLECLVGRTRAWRRLPDPATCRLIRERARVSLRDLADALSINVATLSRWETGERHPTGAHAASWLDALEELARESGCGSLIAEVEAPGDGQDQ